jgi:tryptophan-rich sensory protein
MTKRRWLVLLGFIAASFAAAAIGGTATAENVRTWYPGLIKPSWTPPSWVFGPAWTLLYALMSVSAWRIWLIRERPGARRALTLHFVQLGLNALWSVLFFGLKQPGLALIEIVILWTLLVTLLRAFFRLDRAAGWLWLPYVAWVTFAMGLNASIWWLNR